MQNTAEAYTVRLLKSTGLMNDRQIEDAFSAEKSDGRGILGAIVRLGIAREEELLKKLGELLGYEYVDLGSTSSSKEALTKLTPRASNQFCALPISVDESGTLTVAVCDPLDIALADGVRLAAGCPVRLVLNTRAEIEKTITKVYGVGAASIDQMIDDDRYSVDDDLAGLSKIDVNADGAEASIVKFVNQIIAEADRREATDIHVEPMEDELRIRYRIDGMLHKVDVPPQLNRLKAAIISRIKVMANLDIAEKRLPMDGRIGVRINGEDIDIRVSTMPTAWGESISLRLLQKAGNFVKIQDLGFNEFDFDNVVRLINRPNGIFLVTGPTGSGKSTSLYAFLHEINRMQVRILTVEDPIEYEMKGINQVLVRADIGLTFARALRAFLRQDPDIIMVGEIRDGETADIAINAALTGHMVFSTLHTNNAAGAFARLMDMGSEPFLVASAVAGVMAQRLVRRLCPECKMQIPLDRKMYDLHYPPAGDTVWKAAGCELCNRTGYKGRRGLFELLMVTEDVASAVIARKSTQEIRDIAKTHGMKLLREDGWAKVFNGLTSVEEVMRVTEEDNG